MCMPALVQPQSPHETPVNLQLSWKKTESPTSKVFTTIMFSKPLCCDILIFIQVIFNEIDTHIQLVDFKKIERNCLISFRFCSEDLEVWIRFQLWLQKKRLDPILTTLRWRLVTYAWWCGIHFVSKNNITSKLFFHIKIYKDYRHLKVQSKLALRNC